MQQAAAQPTAVRNTGKVVKVQNAGGYSYIQVEMGTGRGAMLAVSQTDVQPGEYIGWGDYAVMRNFHSKALNKTFGQILFVSQVVTGLEPPKQNRGKVVQTMNGGGYSYLEVDQDGSKIWLAAPMMMVKEGDTVSWPGGATMTNFSSSALGRTFDEIVFVSKADIVQ